jgi:KDO2-lipid IV(A) lauroyltransferase
MGKDRSPLRNRLEFVAYRLARAAAHHLGPSSLARLGSGVGDLFWLLGRARGRVARFNLGLAFPELSEDQRRRLERQVARHFGRVTLDALRLQRVTPAKLLEEVEIVGRQHLEQALALGRGVFLLSAHIGSWEVAALTAGLILEQGFAVVNRPLDNPLLEAELERLRSLFGNRALGKANVSRGMLRQLKAGGAVGILIDQRAQAEQGIEVPFFGQPALTHPVLARLARRTLAPVVPIWGLPRAPGRYRVRFDEPVMIDGLSEAELEDVALTTRFIGITEGIIREFPEQWLWYHDRWRHLRQAESWKKR